MTLEERIEQMRREGKQKPQTLWNYQKLLIRIGVLNDQMDRYEIESRLFALDMPNVRRSTIIALRAVWGVKFTIPAVVGKRYDLPDEQTLRFVCMQSSHETRLLTMMYAGLRVGEAGALTGKQLRENNRLLIDRQLIDLYVSDHLSGGKKHVVGLAPPKAGVGEVVVPAWLVPRIAALTTTTIPNNINKSLGYATKKTGIKVNPHMLRHWLCTDLIAKGVPLPLVQKQMRHAALNTTLAVYNQYNEATLQDLYPEGL